MEGYDLILLGSLYAFPTFVRKYGELQPNGSYQIPAAWQAGLGNGARAGEILGLFATGIISERIGYRKTMLGALFALTGFIFLLFFAKDIVMLQIGEVLCGTPMGFCHVSLRAYLTTYVNLCWVFGQFIASGILRGMLSRSDEWSYRMPFCITSPWWLVRKGRNEEAGKSLAHCRYDGMIHTNEIEKNMSQGTSYWDCFRGTNLRRTEISCLVWAIQVLCGTGLMTYSTYFYKQAGLPTQQSFNMTLAQYGLGIIGTLSSWSLMSRFGRRTIYLGGLVIADVLLLVISLTSIAPASNSRASWAIGSLLLVFIFVYDTTIGPHDGIPPLLSFSRPSSLRPFRTGLHFLSPEAIVYLKQSTFATIPDPFFVPARWCNALVKWSLEAPSLAELFSRSTNYPYSPCLKMLLISYTLKSRTLTTKRLLAPVKACPRLGSHVDKSGTANGPTAERTEKVRR
ncbi:hypothetical protein V1504DRAFT_441685 [Lipomyces starkeyi]